MLLRLAAPLLVILFAYPASAWNALGHKVIAEIAWRQLDPATRQEIVDVFRRHTRFDADFAGKMTDDILRANKETQDRWIFQHAATWPDIARGLQAAARQEFDRPKWHYVIFPLFLDPGDRRALASRLKVNVSTTLAEPDYNILQAIKHCQFTLRSRGAGADAKALAYSWLFDLVGDLHQPLHSTALFSVDQFPDSDRGGNEIPLTRGRNLHSLWDNLLGRQHYLRNVDKELAEISDLNRFGDIWESVAKESHPRKWAQESHELCKSFVYDEVILEAVRTTPPGQTVEPITPSDEYLKRAGHEARRRVIAAGLRLGMLLRDFEHHNRAK